MKKLITIMLSFVMALCFSISAFAAEVIDVGYYAIPKDKFSPTDPLIMNHLVRYDYQNSQYYRFYHVYATHTHELDEYTAGRDYARLIINTTAMAHPVEKTAYGWEEISTHDLDTGIICTGVNVKLSGSFGAKPSSIIVADSATGNEKLYEKMDLNGFESLYMNTALVDILNITGPHPGWSRPISGSISLHY